MKPADMKILTNVTEAGAMLDDCARLLGMLVASVPPDMTKDVRQLATSIGQAAKKIELARLLLCDRVRQTDHQESKR